ncbi:hypothetical protein EK21DRAFT_93431 [Setomelanomma holmii]|uniref:Uncharacterized protein n=1 Tax=Setomelanomma holmii TaxID=210430 RepID=A0A9P4H086_9PLEO|nr:hypothetical protein EK21DRAFT_93431 [Setomelanomma holmii]
MDIRLQSHPRSTHLRGLLGELDLHSATLQQPATVHLSWSVPVTSDNVRLSHVSFETDACHIGSAYARRRHLDFETSAHNSLISASGSTVSSYSFSICALNSLFCQLVETPPRPTFRISACQPFNPPTPNGTGTDLVQQRRPGASNKSKGMRPEVVIETGHKSGERPPARSSSPPDISPLPAPGRESFKPQQRQPGQSARQFATRYGFRLIKPETIIEFGSKDKDRGNENSVISNPSRARQTRLGAKSSNVIGKLPQVTASMKSVDVRNVEEYSSDESNGYAHRFVTLPAKANVNGSADESSNAYGVGSRRRAFVSERRDQVRRRPEALDREVAANLAREENIKQVRFELGRAESRAKERAENLLTEKEKQRALEREEARRQKQEHEDKVPRDGMEKGTIDKDRTFELLVQASKPLSRDDSVDISNNSYSRHPSARMHAPPPVSLPSNFDNRPPSARRTSLSSQDNPFAAPPARGIGSTLDNRSAPHVFSPSVVVHQDPLDARNMLDARPAVRQTSDGRYTLERRGTTAHNTSRLVNRETGRPAGYAQKYVTSFDDDEMTNGQLQQRGASIVDVQKDLPTSTIDKTVEDANRPSSSIGRPPTRDNNPVKPELIIEFGSKNDRSKKYTNISLSNSASKSFSIGSGLVDDVAVDSPGSDASYTICTGYPEAPLPPSATLYSHYQSYNTTPIVPRGHGHHYHHTVSTSAYSDISRIPSLFVTSDPDYDWPTNTRDARVTVQNPSTAAAPLSPGRARGHVSTGSGGYSTAGQARFVGPMPVTSENEVSVLTQNDADNAVAPIRQAEPRLFKGDHGVEYSRGLEQNSPPADEMRDGILGPEDQTTIGAGSEAGRNSDTCYPWASPDELDLMSYEAALALADPVAVPEEHEASSSEEQIMVQHTCLQHATHGKIRGQYDQLQKQGPRVEEADWGQDSGLYWGVRRLSDSSISSYAQSVLSTASLASSATDLSKHSGYSAIQIATATRELITVLEDDEVLAPLYQRAIEDISIGTEKLGRNLRRLFRNYGKHLGQDSGDTLDFLASRLVQVKAREVAHSIVRKYGPPSRSVEQEGPRLQNEESSDEEEITANPVDESIFHDLVFFRGFLTGGEPFAILRAQIRSFALPKSARKEVTEGPAMDAEDQDTTDACPGSGPCGTDSAPGRSTSHFVI